MRTESLKRRVRALGSKLLLLSLVVFVTTACAYAGTVRGRLERRDGHGRSYVAAHVPVTISNQQAGRSAVSYSGRDGMYYINNVPPGTYVLEIWASPGREPIRYTIQVHDQDVTDIAPIVVP